jgi:hypothetical protein
MSAVARELPVVDEAWGPPGNFVSSTVDDRIAQSVTRRKKIGFESRRVSKGPQLWIANADGASRTPLTEATERNRGSLGWFGHRRRLSSTGPKRTTAGRGRLRDIYHAPDRRRGASDAPKTQRACPNVHTDRPFAVRRGEAGQACRFGFARFLLIIRLFHQTTARSVGACRARRSPRICTSFDASSQQRRHASSIWRRLPLARGLRRPTRRRAA